LRRIAILQPIRRYFRNIKAQRSLHVTINLPWKKCGTLITHDNLYVPRFCRFCKTQVESPEHALLECQVSPDIFMLRNVFLNKLFHTVPSLQQKMAELSSIEFLKAMIYERATIVLVANYVHDVLEAFYATPLYRAN
jgi:hypothetical protein